MSAYDSYTNYKDNAGVSSVVFGAKKPLLEVELNEMQEIQKTYMRNVLRNIIGDGITDLSSIKYIDGKLTISDSIFGISGIMIQCDTLTLDITDGSAYLQVWEEDVDFKDTLNKYGNQQSDEVVENWIKDPRSEVETTRRKVIKYNLVDSEDPTKYNLKIADFNGGVMTLSIIEINITNLILRMTNLLDGHNNTLIDNIDTTYETGVYCVDYTTKGTLPDYGSALLYVSKIKDVRGRTHIRQELVYDQTFNYGKICRYSRDKVDNSIWSGWDRYWSYQDNKIEDLSEGTDIKTYIQNECLNEAFDDIKFRCKNARNSPLGADNQNNDFFYEVRSSSDNSLGDDETPKEVRYNVIAYDNTSNAIYRAFYNATLSVGEYDIVEESGIGWSGWIKISDSNHNHSLKELTGKSTQLTSDFLSNIRTQILGNSGHGEFLNAIRNNDPNLPGFLQHGSGVAFGVGDTQGYLNISYNTPSAIIGGGNGNGINWYRNIAFTDSTVANANTLGGHGESHFVRSRHYGTIDVNDNNYNYPYMIDVAGNSSMPDTDWWHLIYIPHRNNDGYGAQIAIGYHGNPRTFIRTARGTTWGGWKQICASNSAPVTVQSSAPSTSELWAW